METRANYVLIGAFALAGFFGLLSFFLWFAQLQLDRQFAYYDVRFTSVSGLGRASEVRFAGLPVGQVVDVRLAPDLDGSVLVRLEVGADTPVRTGSVATIESLGVTGVAFVGISAGDPAEPLLRTDPDDIPEIPAGRSVLQTLTEDAPEIVSQALEVMRMLGEFASPENRDRIQAILTNLESSSGDLGQALQDFAAITGIVGSAATDIAFFTTQLEPIVTAVEQTLGVADTALAAVTAGADQFTRTLADGDEMLATARDALATVDRVAGEDVPALLTELREASAALRGEVETLGPAARDLMAAYTATGSAATARLTEAEALIARLQETLASVDRVAAAAETLIAGDGAALAAAGARLAEQDLPLALADLRAAASSARIMADDVSGLIELQVPPVFDDLRATAGVLRDQMTALGADASALMTEFTATGAAATARLTEAQATLAAADALIARLDGTLGSVERAADSVSTLIDTDGAALVAETRAMIEGASTAVASVSRMAEADLPAIFADVRAATQTAVRVVTEVGDDLTSATGRIEGLSDSASVAVTQAGETFARASATLDAIDAALVTGGRTLEAAERAFDSADTVISGDIAALAGDLRGMMGQLETTLAAVTEDVPEISADLRRASASAEQAFAELERMARELRAPVASFAAGALPQFSQLAREARGLVSSFDRLVRQLERDPSRVLFSRPEPEFRR
jgi:phospholipid/cholesterol/gamma-HCH transport system substrate-binding protein